MEHIIAMSNFDTEYNRGASRQFKIFAGLVVTGICSLATLGYFEIQNSTHRVDRQSNPTQPNTPLTAPSVKLLPTETSTPTTPTPPLSFSTSTRSGHCVTIANPQPRNAFRAWIALGQPGKLVFQNLAGPDGDGSETTVNRQTLPWLVHVGDRFCSSGK